MNRILAAFKCCIFFLLISCSKNDFPDTPGTTGSLQSFNVTIVERTSISAVIQWDSCVNTINNEVPKYRVIIRDRIVHTNLSRLVDSLSSLNKDTVYNGKVVAYISTGDTTFSNFALSTYQGIIYAATYSSTNAAGRLGSFNAYPIIGVQIQPSLWRTNTTSVFSLTISNDTLFTITGNRLTATNASNGSTLWQTNTNVNYLSRATYYSGRLYVCTNLGLTAVNSSNGQVLWTYSSPASFAPFTSMPVVDGGKVFIAHTNYSQGQIHGVDALTGTKVWSAAFNSSISQRPLAANGVVVITSGITASVTAYNNNTGTVLWTRTGLGASIGSEQFNPVLSDENVLVQTSGALFALNLQTGSRAWQFIGNNGNLLRDCITGNGMIYFCMDRNASSGSNVFCISAKTGQLIWNCPFDNGTRYAHLVFAKDRIYCLISFPAGIGSNPLYTFNALTGNTDVIFQSNNPLTLRLYEDINSFIVKRDDAVYYPSYHGNYK